MARNAELEDRITKFAARCVKVCEALPVKRVGSANFSDQLFRSSTSVAANYAEATQAESRKDFVHKLKIALKELTESRTWLKIIAEAGYVGKSSLTALIGAHHFHTLTFPHFFPRDLPARCQLPDAIPVGTHGNFIRRPAAWR